MARKATVRILSSKTDVLWYRHYVGKDKTFEVTKVPGKKQYEIKGGEGRSKIIHMEDCEEIK